MEDSNESGSIHSYFGTFKLCRGGNGTSPKLGFQRPQKDIKARTDSFRGYQPPSRNTSMAKFKKSFIAIFVAIAAVARAAPIGQFSRPPSFHPLTPGPGKDKGAKRSRSPGLFSRQPPPGSHLPTNHIPIGQPLAGLSAISPGAPSNAPVQRHDPEPEDEDDLDARSLVSKVESTVSEAGSALKHAALGVDSIIKNVLRGLN
jgi:hypothetical protein